MPNSPRITAAVANAMADAGIGGTLLNSGFIKIYSGTQPTNGGDAITTQTLLVSLPLNATAFGSASGGVLTANAIGAAVAAASGTAAWFRMTTSGGTAVLDGSVGTSGCDINLNTTTITAGDSVAITSATIAMPRA